MNRESPLHPELGGSTSQSRRLKAACDQCHANKVKCAGGGPPCKRCSDLSQDCHYSPAARMGKPPGSKNRKTLERLREASGRAESVEHSGTTSTKAGAAMDVVEHDLNPNQDPTGNQPASHQYDPSASTQSPSNTSAYPFMSNDSAASFTATGQSELDFQLSTEFPLPTKFPDDLEMPAFDYAWPAMTDNWNVSRVPPEEAFQLTEPLSLLSWTRLSILLVVPLPTITVCFPADHIY